MITNDNHEQPLPIDQLICISDRLYCAVQALMYGDDLLCDHQSRVASVVAEIWSNLDEIIIYEKERYHLIAEELKKFEQGFAYISPISESEV